MARTQRRRTRSTAPAGGTPAARSGPAPTPRWWVPTMLTIMVVGLLWIVVFYLSSNRYPLPQIGSWNLGVGFGLIIVGFAMTTRWR